MKQNQVEYLERLRKQVVFWTVCMILLGISGIVLAIVIDEAFSMVLFIGTIVLLILLYFVTVRKKWKDYVSYFKNEFISFVIKGVVPNAEYLPKKGFTREFVSEAGLIMLGNIFHSEDYVRGSFNDVAFERSDMLIQEHHNSGKTSYTITYLKGRWMVFESNKSFEADLQIIQKGYSYAKKKKGLFTKREERRHELKTEDEWFNKEFTCLCQNDAEAFYLLTPERMQAIRKLKAEADGKLVIGFVNNRIHVIMNSGKDAFEPAFFTKNNYERIATKARQEIEMVTTFVQSLNLDHKIYQ